MRNYETVFIMDPALGDEKTAEEVDRAKSVIESAKGEVLDVQRWGKRKLAYEIKKRREGIYTVIKFKSDGAAVSELERSLRLSEPVLRFMTVQDEGPASLAEGRAPEATGRGTRTAVESPAESSGEAEGIGFGSARPAPEHGGFVGEAEVSHEEPAEERGRGEDWPAEGASPSGDEGSSPEGRPKPVPDEG